MRKLTDNQWESFDALAADFWWAVSWELMQFLLHAGNFGSAQTGNIMENGGRI